MSAWLKRLALRSLAWLAGDDTAKTAEVRVLAAERDAATQAPASAEETAARLREGKF
ncbi:MAG TPA: hypothetical protein VN823_09700 [Stellaceae bacterium]|nr:hypothetical protein [Stellaceae bacterium]